MKLSPKLAIAVLAVIVAIPHILLLTAEVMVNSAAVKPGIENILIHFFFDDRICRSILNQINEFKCYVDYLIMR